MVLISFVFALFFVLAFLADRLPLVKLIGKISLLNKLSMTTIRSDTIEDEEKQRSLLANSASIFKQSLKLSVFIVVILATGGVLVLAGDFLGIVKSAVLLGYLASVSGIVISIVSFCCYFLLKKVYARARV